MAATALHLFDPADAPAGARRRRHKLPDFLREDELKSLFDTARIAWQSTKQPKWRRARERDYLMIHVAYYCALRVEELCRLEIQDIDLVGRLLFVRKGKGCKDGTVPLPGKLARLLKEWIDDRASGVLFPDPRGGHIDQSWFRQRLKALAKRARVARRVHPHIFRHTCAVNLLRRGADIYEVSRFLRHSSLSATVYYLHLVPGRLGEIAELL